VRWNGFRTAAALTLAAAVAVLAYGVAVGDLNVALVVVFPVVYGTGPVGFVGIALLMLTVFLWFAGTARAAVDAARETPWTRDAHAPPVSSRGDERGSSWDEEPGRRTRGGGVIMLGPIPIVFGTDKRTALVMMGLMLALMVTALLVLLVLNAG
jgi:uncharacterized protein (TIGR00304 family)